MNHSPVAPIVPNGFLAARSRRNSACAFSVYPVDIETPFPAPDHCVLSFGGTTRDGVDPRS